MARTLWRRDADRECVEFSMVLECPLRRRRLVADFVGSSTCVCVEVWLLTSQILFRFARAVACLVL